MLLLLCCLFFSCICSFLSFFIALCFIVICTNGEHQTLYAACSNMKYWILCIGLVLYVARCCTLSIGLHRWVCAMLKFGTGTRTSIKFELISREEEEVEKNSVAEWCCKTFSCAYTHIHNPRWKPSAKSIKDRSFTHKNNKHRAQRLQSDIAKWHKWYFRSAKNYYIVISYACYGRKFSMENRLWVCNKQSKAYECTTVAVCSKRKANDFKVQQLANVHSFTHRERNVYTLHHTTLGKHTPSEINDQLTLMLMRNN